jgi:hypothetical protein
MRDYFSDVSVCVISIGDVFRAKDGDNDDFFLAMMSITTGTAVSS